MNSVPFYLMSSPMKLDNSTYTSGFEDMYGDEPAICDCHNQLGHYDWSGNQLENLPELCRRTLGIGVRAEHTSISPNNGEDKFNCNYHNN